MTHKILFCIVIVI